MSNVPQLKFAKPVFRDAINVTVRLGQKWATQTSIGDRLEIASCEGETLGEAGVVGIVVCPLGDIPSGLLAIEHDPACRTAAGLAEELARVYGKTIEPYQMVTALLFRPDLELLAELKRREIEAII